MQFLVGWCVHRGLGVLVTFHEFGHFWVARRFGVKVLRFSVGFGKPLWAQRPRRHRVRDRRDSARRLREDARRARRRRRRRRAAPGLQPPAACGSASPSSPPGPVFNIIFAIALLLGDVRVSACRSCSRSSARSRGVIAGRAPGCARATRSCRSAARRRRRGARRRWRCRGADRRRHDRHARARRGRLGARRRARVGVRSRSTDASRDALLPGLGFDARQPRRQPIIGKVDHGAPATRAGLKAGDRIAGDRWRAGQRLPAAHRPRAAAVRGRSCQLECARGGGDPRHPVTIGADTQDGAAGRALGIGPVGAAVHRRRCDDARIRSTGRRARASAAAAQTWEMTRIHAADDRAHPTGEVSLRESPARSPSREYARPSAQLGLASFLNFLALISSVSASSTCCRSRSSTAANCVY